MDNEPSWMENGSMITIKEVKEEYPPTLSLHLIGGQFKRKNSTILRKKYFLFIIIRFSCVLVKK